jgi:uncharacterized integral membrane protein (TIGR00697 family)
VAVAAPALPKLARWKLNKDSDDSQTINNYENGSLPVFGSQVGLVIVAAYIAAQMIADIASLKIGNIAQRAVDMGTFIYPITFTLRDIVHKTFGKRSAQTLIVCAGVTNALMVLYLLWATKVTADPDSFGGPEFDTVFSPLWRIVLASIVAELISELVDTEIYHWFVTRITTKRQWARVLVSNGASVPLDNLIFVLIAFSPLHLLGDPLVNSWAVSWQIFLVNLTTKLLVTLLSLPLIYLAPTNRPD